MREFVTLALCVNQSVKAGITDFYQKDFCDAAVWTSFSSQLHEVSRALHDEDCSHAVSEFSRVAMVPLTRNRDTQFTCSTALAAASRLLGTCYQRNAQESRGLRAFQFASIFAAFDFQMKGQEWIDKSLWPLKWAETVEGVVQSMQVHIMKDERRDNSARQVVAEIRPSESPKIAIVSVCDYDEHVTPLGSLSFLNKQQYARRHGYELILYNKAPAFQDYFTARGGISESRPPAWSKIDAILKAMVDTGEEIQWVMWMDCDSYFLDQDIKLEQIISAAGSSNSIIINTEERKRSIAAIRELSEWGPEEGQDALSSFENRIKSLVRAELDSVYKGNPSLNCELDIDPLLGHCGTELIASEDGLMLNTGIFFARRSVFMYYFLWKVRSLTFGNHPITYHPWWEQTGIMMMIVLPFVFDDSVWQKASSQGVAPYVSLLSQKQLNTYPPMIAGMLKTHVPYSEGDFIVSFSGCKVYSSQPVCNQLFMTYFLKAPGAQIPTHILDKFNDYF